MHNDDDYSFAELAFIVALCVACLVLIAAGGLAVYVWRLLAP